MLLQILQDPQSKLFELLLHGLSSFSFDKLLHILQSPHSQLQRLSLSACNIGDKEMEKFSAVLSSPSCKLTGINLSANVFTEVGLHHLQKALLKAYTTSRNHPLEMISLCGRQIYVRDEEVTKAMAKVLKSPGCALTTLDLTGRRFDPRWLAHLLGELQTRSNRKKLRSLYLLHASCVNSDRAPNDKLIEALKASTHILNIHFPWPTDAYKQIVDAVMQRNARLKTIEPVGQQEQQLEKPCRIKLFLCGHERVGKTTLRKKILHSSSAYNLARRVKQGMQIEEPSTQGMNLSLLELQGKTTSVVICDLAGQREYHAFHTFFMTSTNEDLFVVVCKYTPHHIMLLQARLQYWLRFIVSLRAQSEAKPMVIVVVNFFDSAMNHEQMSNYAKTATEVTMRKFSTLLDFGQSPDINVFGVNLSSLRTSLCTDPILAAVEMLSYKQMERKPLVPRICQEISSAIDHKEIKSRLQIHSKSAAPIMTVQELLKKYKSRIGKLAARRNESSATATVPSDVAFEEALLELHKIGKVVYFRNDIAAEDRCLEKQLVIVYPLWFYETVVGSFVKPKSEPADASVWTERRIKLMFIEENLCKREHIDLVIKYLEKLELFYPINSGPDPCDDKQLIFPSMIPAAPDQESKLNHWIEMGMRPPQAYSFFGRRLDCKEKETSLIPFGVFARLQVQLHGVYGRHSTMNYVIGYGSIQFCVEDKIEVFIRFEGASGREEEDRHWIDTMVRFPVELSGLREKAADIICKVNDTVFGICRGLDRGLCAGVELEEFVLLGASPSSEVRLLSDVKEDVHSLVLRGQNIGPTNCGEITELLLPGEWRGVLKQMEAAIAELVEEFADSPELETIHDAALQQLIAVHELSESKFIPSLHKLNEVSSKYSGSIYSRLSEQQLIRPAGAAPEDALPLCPYLIDEQGKFRPKLKAMVNVRGARMRLMCESFHGCHEVRSQKGVAITLGSADKWLVNAAPVLATALRLAVGAAVMAALTFSPPVASLFPLLGSLGLDELIKKHMIQKFSIPQHKVTFPEFLKSYLEGSSGLPDVQQSLLHARCSTGLPSGHRLRQFYRYVLEGHEKDVDMERDFSLYHVHFPAKRRSLWVCEAHISGGIIEQRSFNPFKDLSQYNIHE